MNTIIHCHYAENEDLHHYKRIVEKYGDVKKEIVLLLHKKNLGEITKLWNNIRTEARFVVAKEVFNENKEFYFYCGQTLQQEIIYSLKINGVTEEEFKEITNNLNNYFQSPSGQ